MSTQEPGALNRVEPGRRPTGGHRAARRGDAARQYVLTARSPQARDAGRAESLFSIMTVLAVIALAACSAAAVAANYGPVFTQSTLGP